MNQLPLYIPIVFVCSALVALIFLFKALGRFKALFYILSGWLFIQTILGLSGFYHIQVATCPGFYF